MKLYGDIGLYEKTKLKLPELSGEEGFNIPHEATLFKIFLFFRANTDLYVNVYVQLSAGVK